MNKWNKRVIENVRKYTTIQMAQFDNKNSSSPSDGKEMLCDNPISLDEIEDGLWLGVCTIHPLLLYRVLVWISFAIRQKIFLICELTDDEMKINYSECVFASR